MPLPDAFNWTISLTGHAFVVTDFSDGSVLHTFLHRGGSRFGAAAFARVEYQEPVNPGVVLSEDALVHAHQGGGHQGGASDPMPAVVVTQVEMTDMAAAKEPEVVLFTPGDGQPTLTPALTRAPTAGLRTGHCCGRECNLCQCCHGRTADDAYDEDEHYPQPLTQRQKIVLGIKFAIAIASIVVAIFNYISLRSFSMDYHNIVDSWQAGAWVFPFELCTWASTRRVFFSDE